MKNITAATIDEYIAGFPKNTQKLLRQMRAIVRKAAPEAEETIKYAMPTFTFHGNLVHFGGYKNHIGFYPAPRKIDRFKKALSAYAGSKGTIRFGLDKPLPMGLISKIVKFRILKNLEKVKTKIK